MDGSIESGSAVEKGEKQTLQSGGPGQGQIRSREDRSPPAKAKARKSTDSTIGALRQTYGGPGGGRRSINPAPYFLPSQ
ncbi:protein phosphatase 2C domain containing protein [Anopheles sinensis]|uniref:Protein phosphatase 2C domain containing protein n=1 Tax=Anopheles sinensis TaxID=74873 RepID=A0A084W8W5_ANOSI|nr:protein phosphatase 2C domain containing protein [Anopheles sinensis]